MSAHVPAMNLVTTHALMSVAELRELLQKHASEKYDSGSHADDELGGRTS